VLGRFYCRLRGRPRLCVNRCGSNVTYATSVLFRRPHTEPRDFSRRGGSRAAVSRNDRFTSRSNSIGSSFAVRCCIRCKAVFVAWGWSVSDGGVASSCPTTYSTCCHKPQPSANQLTQNNYRHTEWCRECGRRAGSRPDCPMRWWWRASSMLSYTPGRASAMLSTLSFSAPAPVCSTETLLLLRDAG
jgi:hypothetical protein